MNENNLIYEKYIINESIQRLKRIIQSGCDVYVQTQDNLTYIIYNTGSKNKGPLDSVATTAVLQSLKDLYIDDNQNKSYKIDANVFFEEDNWLPITDINLENIKQSGKKVIMMDHNGTQAIVI